MAVLILYNIYPSTTYPPKMARNGLTGDSSALAKYVSSFLSKKPAAF